MGSPIAAATRFASWSTQSGPRARQRPGRRESVLSALLLIATVVSTTWVNSAAFSAWLLLILFCHEMGHYLTARHYRVRTSLPFFLPFPLPPFGTFGALILLRQRIRTRRVLFDVGIAGPLAGIPAAIVATIWGLAHSSVVDTSSYESTASLLVWNPLFGSSLMGSSLLFGALKSLFFGDLGPGQVILLHPVAFAGWAGLFVTSLNLLPVGQLDGGHILYGLIGRRARMVSRTLALVILVAGFWFPGWWFLLVLLLLTKLRHPSAEDESVPLGRARVLLGVFALVFFLLTFIPRPIRIF